MEIPQDAKTNLLKFLEECGGKICDGKLAVTPELLRKRDTNFALHNKH